MVRLLGRACGVDHAVAQRQLDKSPERPVTAIDHQHAEFSGVAQLLAHLEFRARPAAGRPEFLSHPPPFGAV